MEKRKYIIRTGAGFYVGFFGRMLRETRIKTVIHETPARAAAVAAAFNGVLTEV